MYFRDSPILSARTLRLFWYVVGLSVLCFSIFCTVAKAAGGGTITLLTASSGNPSTVLARVAADGGKKINNSNITFQIYDKNLTLVGSYGPVSVSLAAGATQDITWSWNVNGFEPFTVNACWSPGGSGNCKIDATSTQFNAVPSIGFFLGGIAVVLIGVWFWRVRRQMVTAKASS